jgi:uncharacterized membrane protein YjjP (DUF1212 family)
MIETIDLFAYILAFIWGILWALFLQHTALGYFLAQKRAWVTVVVGVGVDTLILLPLIGLEPWLQVMIVIALSSLGIITRSLYNEWAEMRELLNLHGPEEK